jgi:hypothetical protein
MAGLGGKNWGFQEEVTSSDVNGFLADQVVMRFADAATRTAGFGGAGEPTLAEGMLSYLDDVNRVDFYNGSAWQAISPVLQVVSTTKTDTFSASVAQGASTAVTGLTVTITPVSASNKVLVFASVASGDTSSNTGQYTTLTRGGTAIFIGDTAGNRQRVSAGGYAGNRLGYVHFTFLDSPASTSALTYGISIGHTTAGSVTCNVNFGGDNTDASYTGRGASSITVMEIAG